MSQRWNYHVAEIQMQMFGKSMTERAQEELDRLGKLGWLMPTGSRVSSVQSNAADSIRLFLKKPA